MEILFSELKETLAQVAEKEQCIDDLFDSLNKQLAALNLGIPVWLMEDPILFSLTVYEEEEEQDGSIRRWRDAILLGYDRVGTEWQLVTREVELEADELKRKRESGEPWDLYPDSVYDSASPRQLVLLIPKLIQMMTQKAKDFLEIVAQIEVFTQEKN